MGVVGGVGTLGHSLLHVTFGTEAHEIVLAVAVQRVGGDLVDVIHLEFAYCAASGTPAGLLRSYLDAECF